MIRKMKLKKIISALLVGLLLLAWSSGVALATAVSLTGKAKVLNTNNSYLDFTNYSSNVTMDDVTGNFSGYAFLEDLGWVDFGSTDNPSGPVDLNLATGAVTGKAYVLNTAAYLDFTNYNSNVFLGLGGTAFSGFVFSEDVGWLNFADTGVLLGSSLPGYFEITDPGENSYTNSERPTFKWRAASVSDLTKYVVEADNGETGDFVVDNIPVTGSEDNNQDRYLIHYENFSDSDNTNNYISVYTKSSTVWDSGANDGKLKEGKRTWVVRAHDNVGRVLTKSRTVLVDRTGPSLGITKINNSAFADNLATLDTTPTVYGKLTDSLNGDKTENKVAAGPKSVEVRVEKRNFLGLYDLQSLTTVNFTETYWSSTGAKITDNTQNISDKYSTFSFTPANSLGLGTYRVTIAGKDNASNTSSAASFNLRITTLAEIPAEEKEIIEELEEEPEKVFEVPVEEPQAVQNFITSIVSTLGNIYWSVVGVARGAVGYIASFWQGYSNLVYGTSQKSLTFIGSSYNILAERAPGLIGKALVAIREAAGSTSRAIATALTPTANTIGNFAYRQKVKLLSIAEILFDKNPTVITGVKVAEVGKDYAVISWETNHHTKNNKVNYGESLSYGQDVLSQERARHHELKIVGLKPNKKYFFEVMSQNKNYVYDAWHEFITLENSGGIPANTEPSSTSPQVQGIRAPGGVSTFTVLAVAVTLVIGLIFFWRRRKKAAA